VLDGRPGVAPDLVVLEEKLIKWREEVRASLKDATYPATEPAPDLLNEALRDGRAIVDVCDPLPTRDLLTRWSSSLFEVIDQALPATKSLVDRFRGIEATQDPDDVLPALFGHGWRALDDPALLPGETSEDDLQTLGWIGRQLARPFFHHLGELLAGHEAFAIRDVKTRGCPCCGGAPRMSRYEREEGQRYLWCELCDVQWRYARLTCPFCGNPKQETLGYLSFEDLDHYRVDVCEVCHGYLRAKDERELPEGARVDFTIEDVGTLHLCLVAEQKGYHSGSLISEGRA